MKVIGFDGRTYNLTPAKLVPNKDDERQRSELHLRVRKFLKKLFPVHVIAEEVTLPGSRRRASVLYADFFIPSLNLIIEAHGEQHLKYTQYFHKNKRGFALSKIRDREKIEWCKINKINLVALLFNETEDEWLKKIQTR